MMTKDDFYQFDFYFLEQKYVEYFSAEHWCLFVGISIEKEFIKILDNEPILSSKIDPFIKEIIEFLFLSIKEGESIEIAHIALPQIENDLRDILKSNSLYTIYLESKSENSLSEIVFNKFLSRIFRKDGHNNENYIIQNYFHDWLEKKLAFGIVEDLRFNSVDILISLIDKTEMLHSFYSCLVKNIPKKWIDDNERDWIDINVDPENIVDSIRTFDKTYFNSYITLFESADKSNLWNFIKEVTRGSDYAMLNHEYSFKASVLIKNDILLFSKFWDNLKFPIIQESVFHSFNFKIERYLEIANALISEEFKLKSDLSVLLLIIAKNYFEESNKLTSRLSFYDDNTRITKDNRNLFKKGKAYYNKLQVEKEIQYNKLFEALKIKLSNDNIEDWIFSYKPRITNRQTNKHNEIYNSEIELLNITYKSFYSISTDFNLKSFNLQKLNFYVEIVRDLNDNNKAIQLLEITVKFVESDKFFWDNSYSEPYWSSIKAIGYLISLHSDPVEKSNQLIKKFKINHQGWNPIKIDYKPLTKESFIYCCVAFLFEHDSAFKDLEQKEFFFKEILNHVLIQNRYSQIDNSKDYQQPLHLLFLVANQIFQVVKESFEKELIDNYDNLYSLLSILSSDNIPICSQSKLILMKRLEKEFVFEKRQFNNRSQTKKVKEMEKMVDDLKLEE